MLQKKQFVLENPIWKDYTVVSKISDSIAIQQLKTVEGGMHFLFCSDLGCFKFLYLCKERISFLPLNYKWLYQVY